MDLTLDHLLKLKNKNNWVWKLIVRIKKGLGYSGSTSQTDADNLDHVQFFSKKDIEDLSKSYNLKVIRFGKANFIEDVFPFSFFARRIKFLQKMDCKLADWLPHYFAGGFFFVCEKIFSDHYNIPQNENSLSRIN